MAESSAPPNGQKPTAAPEQDQVRRDILPIPDAKHVGLTTYDAKDPDTTYPPITALRPPKAAPNVLVVMLDDVGFGGSSAFGGPCNTPTAERLAAGGLKLNRFHADITVPESGATGVVITQGGIVGGWSLYAYEGRLKYCYNFLGVEHFMVTAEQPIPVGKHQVRMEFAYDGGGLAKGGDVTLYYDGKSVGKGRVEHTQPMIYSADEACDVGADTGSPASPDYGPTGNKFSGQIDWVQIDIGDDSHDHLIKAEDRLTVAMARQ